MQSQDQNPKIHFFCHRFLLDAGAELNNLNKQSNKEE